MNHAAEDCRVTPDCSCIACSLRRVVEDLGAECGRLREELRRTREALEAARRKSGGQS
jgi:hypothetical protein